MLRYAVAAAVLIATAPRADERLDHRGSLGLLLAAGADARAVRVANIGQDDALAVPLELGATAAPFPGSSGELLLAGRAELTRRTIFALTAGYRGYFGEDNPLKTLLDLDLRAEVAPYFSIGPRVGMGLQYDFSPLAGVFAVFAAHFGVGTVLRFGGELTVGLQLRSYLLE